MPARNVTKRLFNVKKPAEYLFQVIAEVHLDPRLSSSGTVTAAFRCQRPVDVPGGGHVKVPVSPADWPLIEGPVRGDAEGHQQVALAGVNGPTRQRLSRAVIRSSGDREAKVAAGTRETPTSNSSFVSPTGNAAALSRVRALEASRVITAQIWGSQPESRPVPGHRMRPGRRQSARRPRPAEHDSLHPGRQGFESRRPAVPAGRNLARPSGRPEGSLTESQTSCVTAAVATARLEVTARIRSNSTPPRTSECRDYGRRQKP
jgi:hypothetical protein